MGIEPTPPAWKAGALPLSYTRTPHPDRDLDRTLASPARSGPGHGGGGRIRTYVRFRGQIYSLLPLTTRPPLQTPDARPTWPGWQRWAGVWILQVLCQS